MKTVLHDRHVALGAKMVDFAGWEMPVQYTGVVPEHHRVRERVGLFDVSHMGRILVEGSDAEALLDYLSTNKIADKKEGTATYTVWAAEGGGSVDDVIVYRKDATHFFVVANAGNREKDLEHLKKYAEGFDVTITDRYKEDGILALQGPLARRVMAKVFPEAETLKAMHFISVTYEGDPVILSGTGYTGSGGFEIYAENSVIAKLWDRLLEEGKAEEIAPIGLGARDTLRLEMGYALYGHELSDAIAPTESVSRWTVRWKKGDFLGREALEELEESSERRRAVGIILKEKGIAREGYPVFHNGEEVGHVTSGTFSPTLDQAIAIVLASKNLKEGDPVEVQIRKNRCAGEVVTFPFLT